MNHSYVHLNIHTQYSIMDSTIRIPNLMQESATNNFPAVTLTDQNNVFGMVKFYRQAINYGIKPIIGCDLFIADPDDESRHNNIILLCANNEGYKNLTQLITKSWLEDKHVMGQEYIKNGSIKPIAVG